MNATVATRAEGDRTVVDVVGEIDLYTAPLLRAALNEAVADGARRIVVDMTGTQFLDSTGLGVLVGGLKRVRTVDGDLELVCSSEKILKVFRITGLLKVFVLHANLEAALSDSARTTPLS